jgi:hypothetical protein
MSEQEQFEHAYYYFMLALQALAMDAKSQCEVGNYNTAWELKFDVSAGTYIFNLPERLSQNQKDGILRLIAQLETIPEEILRATEFNEDENLAAMNHPCWEPLRAQATALVALLEPATKKNKVFYKL